MLKSVQQLSLHKSHSIMITASVDTKSQCLPTFACLHDLHACRLAFRLLPVGSILNNGSWEALASNPELPPGTEMPELIGPELIVFTWNWEGPRPPLSGLRDCLNPGAKVGC
jgi:hypothetical protein